MKTLGEIIDLAKSGEKPDYDDLLYAVCAMDSLMVFDHLAMTRMVIGESSGKSGLIYSPAWQFEERFNRVKRAFEKSPKEWLGWDNDPANPECLNRRKISNAVIDKISPSPG